MKTSQSALKLNDYLVSRLNQPSYFEDQASMIQSINDAVEFFSKESPLLRDNPLICAVHVWGNSRLTKTDNIQLDDDMLINACKNYLSMTPIDEIPPEGIVTLSRLFTNKDRENDATQVLRVISQAFNRADELEPASREPMKDACRRAFQDFRDVELINDATERALDTWLTREQGIRFVKELGFRKENILSLRHWNPAMEKSEHTPR